MKQRSKKIIGLSLILCLAGVTYGESFSVKPPSRYTVPKRQLKKSLMQSLPMSLCQGATVLQALQEKKQQSCQALIKEALKTCSKQHDKAYPNALPLSLIARYSHDLSLCAASAVLVQPSSQALPTTVEQKKRKPAPPLVKKSPATMRSKIILEIPALADDFCHRSVAVKVKKLYNKPCTDRFTRFFYECLSETSSMPVAYTPGDYAGVMKDLKDCAALKYQAYAQPR